MDIGILTPNIEIITKSTNIHFKDNRVLLKLPVIYNDMFVQFTPKFIDTVFCLWELPTSFDTLKKRVEQMQEAGIMPILLTFSKVQNKAQTS